MIFPFKAWSATFNVSTPAEFQAALDTAASNGEDDTIYVAPGTYNLTSTLTYSVADGDGSLTIEAQDPSNPPELYGRNSVQVMNINNDSDGDGGDSGQTITVRGLVFQNGNTSGWGGGLYLKTGQANILVENCQFLSNSAQGDAKTLGGGLYVAGFGGSVDIRGNTFEGNSATVGGGTHVYSSGGPINLVDNTFTSNIATITQSADAQGGGASVDPEHTTATITNNTFSNNRVTGISGDGGGLRVWLNNADDQVVVSNNHFVSNTSEGGTGGGIYINGPGDARIINNIFENNTAAYQGGGVNIAPHYITATITNNTFYGNTARVGGGLFVDLLLLFIPLYV
jgi:hypothetical protein